MSARTPSRRSHCQNCGAPLSGPYCPTCGQHDVDYHRSFWHIAEDALEVFVHFDNKFFKSTRYIFTRPGFLTTEFLAGRRARYMNPVRFYIFASFMLFAVSVLTGHHMTPVEKAAAKAAAGTGDLREAMARVKEAENISPEAKEALSWLDDPLRIKIDAKDNISAEDFTREFWHLLPEMLFFCLPFLAMVLKLVYIRSGRLYVEHLIFALHIQTLSFLSFIVVKAGGALGMLAGTNVKSRVGAILLLGMFFLIFRSFRTVYGQGRVKTALSLILVLAGYGLILVVAFAGLGYASIYLVARDA